LLSDTDGNVFGGFTPVRWESSGGYCKSDSSLKSFLFTLKNQHSVPPRRFALKPEKMISAICCNSVYCTAFGGPYGWCDIWVSDNCNTKRDSSTRIGTHSFGNTYVNDTAFEYFLTGAEKFTVKEIEVFEIAD
jgi:hypothetical protein